jgi:predicted nucleic acid-binding protein
LTLIEPPDGPLMVDTDVFSIVTFRKDGADRFDPYFTGHVALSFATVGELRAGAINAKWGEKRRAELDERIRRCVVVPSSDAVVNAWALLHARCRGQLHNGGANDMWTAACAVSQPDPLPILTHNRKDFRQLRKADPRIVLVHPDGE